MDIPTDEQKIQMARSLFTHPDFRLIPDLLSDMEREAIDSIRRADLGKPHEVAEFVLAIQVVDRFRNTIRALAEHAGVQYGR